MKHYLEIRNLRKTLGLDSGYVKKTGCYIEVMRSDVTINIAKDFSRTPYGRYLGSSSAKVFKDKFLKPFIDIGADKIIIILDGTYGFVSSWLHEAFGNLLKEYPQEKRQSIMDMFSLISDEDPSVAVEIREYMWENL
jgi:hypothetical protein